MATPDPVEAHRHVKTNHTAVTEDGWRLHIVRTQCRNQKGPGRTYPVVLVPGMCSSGAYTFDLSPAVSFADWLADRQWDVWTIELRGNGLSDKPSVFSSRSHWWTVDDMVEKDIPAALAYITMATGCTAAHCMGHSMGGMILTAALARGDHTSARMRSVTLIGSSCFLEGSWWAVALPTFNATRYLYSVPAGATLRFYSNLAFTRLGVRAVDVLYFWPTNTDPALARAVLARNFSAASPGVITQFRSAFKTCGLRSSHKGHPPFADPQRLAAVQTPVMLMCGDKDKMCPPQGAAKQYQMLGSKDKKLVILGPKSGQSTHFGHFDILMGKCVHVEVFPKLHSWLESHDTCAADLAISPPAPGSQPSASSHPYQAMLSGQSAALHKRGPSPSEPTDPSSMSAASPPGGLDLAPVPSSLMAGGKGSQQVAVAAAAGTVLLPAAAAAAEPTILDPVPHQATAAGGGCSSGQPGSTQQPVLVPAAAAAPLPPQLLHQGTSMWPHSQMAIQQQAHVVCDTGDGPHGWLSGNPRTCSQQQQGGKYETGHWELVEQSREAQFMTPWEGPVLVIPHSRL